QQNLITTISQANPHTVLIYMNGGALDLAEGDAAQAIIETWLGGESVGSALSGILTGKVNPSGHLAESIPFRLQDTGCYDSFPGDGNTAVYGEGIFVGYRHYDHVHCPVRYPFGFGLSYTTFEYTDLDIQSLGNNIFRIGCRVKNTGEVKGKTVVQVYTGQKSPKIMRPIRELRAFKKVALNPGEAVTLTFELEEDAFTYYNAREKKWCTEGGVHTIEVGESSRELPLVTDVEITRNYIPTITKYSYLGEILDHPKGPRVFEVIAGELEQLTGENIMDLQGFAKTMFYSTPICKLTTASHGLIAPRTIELLIEYLNNGDLTDTFTMDRLKVGDEGAGGTSRGLIAGIFDWVGKIMKGNVATVYSVEDKMSVLLNNPDTRGVLARYCPEDILDGEQLRVAARMGLTLRRIQKLVPQDIFPETLLEEINTNLKEIKKEI
ncbi:MAG: fibronectin type III-like domain-contianing protein, partial [Eubacterium sp.]